jgi:release factor glutamine methyltransferase
MNDKKLYEDIVKDISTKLIPLPGMLEETAEDIVFAFWYMAAGVSIPVEAERRMDLPPLDDQAITRLHELVGQRLAGIPLAYITGRQCFMGLELMVERGVLIPRKETELIGRSALDLLRRLVNVRNDVTLIDVCTGSGNLAVALAHYVPPVRVFASDLSPEAVELARWNIEHFGLENRVEVLEGDLFAPFDHALFYGKVDLITCNPPYISTSKVETHLGEITEHEPRMAFDGGSFGIKILLRFINEAPRFLREGGWIIFEVGLGQGPGILARLVKNDKFCEVTPIEDSSGVVRGIMAARSIVSNK